MIRKIIVALIVVLAICSFAIWGFIAFQKFYLRQFLRTKTVEVLGQCVIGEITVGEVDFNPLYGLTVKELKIGDPTAGNKQSIISVPNISIEFNLFYFLRGKVKVKGITITSPEVFIARSDKGTWNIREFIRPDFKWPFTPVEGSFKDGIVIKDAGVGFRDAGLPEDSPISLTDIQIFLFPSPQTIKTFYLSGNIDDKFWGDYSIGGILDRENAKLNISVLARNVFLREELFKKFPSGGAKLWDELAPTGSVDLTCTLNYDKHSDNKFNYECVADWKEGSFRFKQMPLPANNVTGTIEFCNGCLRINHLNGSVGSREDAAHFSVKGDVCMDERGGIITVDVSNIAGTEETVRMIPKVGEKIWTDYKPTGRTDVCATFIMKDSKAKVGSVTLDLRDVEVTYAHFPLPAHGVTANLEISNGKLYMKNAHGYAGEGTLTPFNLQGQVSLKGDGGSVSIDISNLDVTEKIVKMIPSNGQSIWSDYMPIGRCDVAVKYDMKDSYTNYDAIIDLRDIELHGDRLPFLLTGVNGRLEYSKDNLYFRDVDGYIVSGLVRKGNELANAHFDLDGYMDIKNHSGLITFNTTNLLIDEHIVRNIPDVGVKLWEAYNPRGRVDVSVDYRIVGEDDSPEFYAEINCKEVEILCNKLPVPVSNLNGFIETDGLTLFTRNLRGRACNGDVSALLGLDLSSSSPEYRLKLDFVDADVREFLQVALASEKQLSGKVSGHSEFYGIGNGPEALSGKGEINLSGGNLFDIPIILSLFKVLSLSLPERDVFHTANVKYTIENGIVHIEKANLISNSVEIAGTGDVGLDGKLDMLAIVAFRGNSFLSGIPIVGEVKDYIVGGIVSRLTKFEIKGTVKNPETKTVSFKALKRPSVKNMFELLKGE